MRSKKCTAVCYEDKQATIIMMGDTLNRFDFIPKHSMIKAIFKNWRMHRLTLVLFGMFNTPLRYSMYKLRHGNEERLPDLQKLIPRDTFHHIYQM
ncbi:hypothetical protein ACD661_13755 [Legionella lytica]|uniref:Uncharacterized protein n=1 Tax=Legionella lytica TaxID=96232 RepID=A0ABW8DBS1_9GAMM